MPAARPIAPTSGPAHLIAVVRPMRVDAVIEAVAGCALGPVVVEAVRGYGRQKDHLEFYKGGATEGGFLPKVRIEFRVDGARLDEAVTAIRAGAATGRIGDGKIFVHEVATWA